MTGLPGALTVEPAAHTVYAVRPDGLEAFHNQIGPARAAYCAALGFKAEANAIAILPAGDGGAIDAVLGLGELRSPFAFGDLPTRLPEGVWRPYPGDYRGDDAVLGFCVGAYHYGQYKPAARATARLSVPGWDADPALVRAVSAAAAIEMVRDLVNTPANALGPAELADAALALGARYGARCDRTWGADLARLYPAIAAVGAGSARAPVVAAFHWSGSGAAADAPLVSLCGKGVCFDTGGYDLKPSAAMLRMKKDMGGAANMLGLARMVMDADLPIRLAVRIGCVENSVSGTAMRPSDVIATRRGLSVEIGNTDAEGRLVLCDLLAEASDEAPSLLIDAATLTGAARTALGPELPALFCDDDGFAARLADAGAAASDPVWRLPLWPGYDQWLKSTVADMNNVSARPMAGAIVAALFLKRFVRAGTRWAHIDMYAWNDHATPGRPEGGEAQAIRALFAAIEEVANAPRQ